MVLVEQPDRSLAVLGEVSRSHACSVELLWHVVSPLY